MEYRGRDTSQRHFICGTFDTDAAAGFVRNPDLLPRGGETYRARRVGRPEEIVRAAVLDRSAHTDTDIDGGVSGCDMR